jgi:hypothetical protein
METLNIKAVLSSSPANIVVSDELLQITKGASAALSFNYSDKVYSYDDTDQITFMLKQGNKIYRYRMFIYLIPTTDLQVIPGKNYYTKVSCPANSFKCTATKVVPSASDCPIDLGYYEEADGNYSWRNTEYLLDTRFYYENLGKMETVSLLLHSEDTLQFKTNTSKPMEFEVAVRLNTETLPSFAYKDTVIIEPQPKIIVTDSLFSQI